MIQATIIMRDLGRTERSDKQILFTGPALPRQGEIIALSSGSNGAVWRFVIEEIVWARDSEDQPFTAVLFAAPIDEDPSP